MLWVSLSKILPIRLWDHQRFEGASCCLNLWIMGSIPSHLFMTVTFKAWKLAGVWWMRLLRNPERAVSSFPWQMPYSMKQKPITTEVPLSCPFGQDVAGKKKQTYKVPPCPPPQYCSRPELGLVHSCHRRGCAFPAFLHCPPAQCKPSTQGYSRRENYFLLKRPFVCQLAHSFHLHQHYAHEKEFGQKKKTWAHDFFV